MQRSFLQTLLTLFSFVLGVGLALGVSLQFSLIPQIPSVSDSAEPNDYFIDEVSPLVFNSERESWVELFALSDPETRLWAAERIVEYDTEDWPQGEQGRFLCSIAPRTLTVARLYRIPPSVTLAQAILESDWGRSTLARKQNNLFGIKVSDTRYASFESRAGAISHHGRLLSSRRYARAHPHWTDWRRFLRAIAPIYATNPRYVSLVSGLVKKYHLSRWDRMVVAAVDMAATVPPVEAPLAMDIMLSH